MRDETRDAESWLRARVVELEQTLASIRERQVAALAEGSTSSGEAEDSGGSRVFRHVLQRLPTPVLVLAEDDTVLFANLAAARFFGASFNASGRRTLAQCIDAGQAAKLTALRPSENDEHGWIESFDGGSVVRCHAFLAKIDDLAVRCIQIDWNLDDVGSS